MAEMSEPDSEVVSLKPTKRSPSLTVEVINAVNNKSNRSVGARESLGFSEFRSNKPTTVLMANRYDKNILGGKYSSVNLITGPATPQMMEVSSK
jgi:hypothetical protein